MLADNPRLGPARPDIAEGPRLFPIQCCVILFREPADGIEIVRIVHGMRRRRGAMRKFGVRGQAAAWSSAA